MQRKPKAPPNRKVKNNDKAFVLIAASVFGTFMAVVLFSSVQCTNAAAITQKHEKDVLANCYHERFQSLYLECLRREWDRVNDVPDWMKEK